MITAFTLPDTSFTECGVSGVAGHAVCGHGRGGKRGGVWRIVHAVRAAGLADGVEPFAEQSRIVVGGRGQAADFSVSGPWPVLGPDPNYKNQAFYFPSASGTVDLTITSYFPQLFSNGKFSVYYPNSTATDIGIFSGFPPGSGFTNGTTTVVYKANQYPPPPQMQVTNFALEFTAECEFSIVIGGSVPVLVQGAFAVDGLFYWGAQQTNGGPITDAAGSPQGPQVTGNFPGTMSITFGPKTGYSAECYPFWMSSNYSTVEVAFVVNQMLSPGTYTMKLTCPNPGDDWMTITTTNTPTVTNQYSSSCYIQPRLDFSNSPTLRTGALGGVNTGAVATLTIDSGAVQTAGIHNSMNVFKLDLGADENGINAIAGMIVYNNTFGQVYTLDPSNIGAFWEVMGQPTFDPPFTQMLPWSLSSLPAGFWAAEIPSISSLNIVGAALMPWNLMRTKYSVGGSVMVNPSLLADLAPTIAAIQQLRSNEGGRATA